MKVWIVEIWNAARKQWEPTVGCQLTRSEARNELRYWKEYNPSDRFRLARYKATKK